MSLGDLQRTWNDLARKDAMWAVLTGRVGASREWDEAAFFRSGVDEIASVLDRVRAAGASPGPARALDFGCGPGRLTQALCAHFERADGVDISEEMVGRARALNRVGGRCEYHVNAEADLRCFGDATFDFIYSNITLQHIEPEYSRGYIEEFFRVARPGGVVVFQLTGDAPTATHPVTSSVEVLPPDACKASISAPARIEATAGTVIIVPTVVRNASAQKWPARGAADELYSIRLGNHWRGRFGRMRVFNDVREQLPYDVEPGDAVEIGFRVKVPAKPGTHVLELDMVQENVRWFAAAGSTPARVRVKVRPVPAGGEADSPEPRMQMHGIPRPEVEALIARSGGRVLAVDENDAAGPSWTSYRYIAVRSSNARTPSTPSFNS